MASPLEKCLGEPAEQFGGWSGGQFVWYRDSDPVFTEFFGPKGSRQRPAKRLVARGVGCRSFEAFAWCPPINSN